ncbi:MAG: FtsW/RodA/SpoVE family cell cycle protein [Faecalibacterium sp.]
MAANRKKRSVRVPVFQRDPGPWSHVLINWLATLGIIMVFGLVMLFSASYTTGYLRMGDSLHYIKSQIICMLLGLAVMVVFSYVDHRFLRKLVWPLYIIGLLLLVAVLFSTPLNGCRRWLRIGGLTVQVSELMKFEMILLTAHIASGTKRIELLDPDKKRWWPFGKNGVPFRTWLYHRLILELAYPLMWLIPVVVLLMLEPHMSGIVLTCAIVGTILLLGGNGGIIAWGGAGALIFLLETILQHVDSIPYLQSRLDGWTQDLTQMTDQTLQSLYAIGSGGLTGLGLGNSVEKQLWLPESTNDFIFSVVCEELGFVGAVLIILLFVVFLIHGFWLAFHAENLYCTMVGIGIMAQIAWQVFCNIAVVTNTLPNTGISLPFFSSGGTSLILLLAEMGVMINIGRNGARAEAERERARAEREARRRDEQQAHAPIVLENARRMRMEQE